jgi:hypothetical protein
MSIFKKKYIDAGPRRLRLDPSHEEEEETETPVLERRTLPE